MRLPEPGKSQAILIGTGEYGAESALPDLPAVVNNLHDLQGALADSTYGWLTPQAVTTVLNPASPDQLGITIAEKAARAEDLVLIYYAGHGLLSPRGELYLATTRTNRERLRFTAFPYDGIREILHDSPAANRVVILDCCYSGRAITAMTDPQSAAYDQLDITGTYILTSTTATTMAQALDGARHTAFTGELITLLRVGDPELPHLITLDHIYRAAHRSLTRRGLPRPQQRGSDSTPHLALVRNPALIHPSPAIRPSPPPNTTSAPTPATEPPAVAMSAPARPAEKPAGGPLPTAAPLPTPPAESVAKPQARGATMAVVLAAQLLVGIFWGQESDLLSLAWEGLAFEGADQWLGEIYSLSLVTLLLLAAKLGDVHGHRRLLRSGLVVFSASVLLAGLAGTTSLLLAAFALAGIATSFVAVNGLALLLTAFSDAPGRALVVFTAVTGGSSAIASLRSLPGFEFMTGRATWLVVGAVGLVIAVAGRMVNESERRATGPTLAQVITLTIGVGLLVFGLEFGEEYASPHWSSPGTWGPLIAAVAILIPSVLIRTRLRSAVVPCLMMFVGAALFTLIPFGNYLFLRYYLSLDAPIVAVFMLIAIGLSIGMILALLLINRLGIRPSSLLGGIAGAAGLYIPTMVLANEYAYGLGLIALAVGGIGGGVILYCGATASLAGIGKLNNGTAAGMFNLIWLLAAQCAETATLTQADLQSDPESTNYIVLIVAPLTIIAGLLPLFSRHLGRYATAPNTTPSPSPSPTSSGIPRD